MTFSIRSSGFSLALFLSLLISVSAFAEDMVRIGGTGAALRAVETVAAAYRARTPNARIVVLPSLGSTGSIRALADGKIDIAIASRALTQDERDKGLTDRVLGETAWGFATPVKDPPNFTSDDIARIYQGKIKSWGDGAPLRIILRPKQESDTATLTEYFPAAAAAIEAARLRPEFPVAATDQDNAAMALAMVGSLTTMTLSQVSGEKLALNFIAIDGRKPSIEGLRSGSYPYRKTFHIAAAARPNSAAAGFIGFLESAEAAASLLGVGIRTVK